MSTDYRLKVVLTEDEGECPASITFETIDDCVLISYPDWDGGNAHMIRVPFADFIAAAEYLQGDES
jgi:hypothetical protein